jgi:hypothetical protein
MDNSERGREYRKGEEGEYGGSIFYLCIKTETMKCVEIVLRSRRTGAKEKGRGKSN